MSADPDPGWAARRARQRRTWQRGVQAAAGLSVAAAVVSDRLLWAPLLVVVPVVSTLAVHALWAVAWRQRTTAAGEPVVRASVPRRLARRSPEPESWLEALAPGVLVVAGEVWRWRPARPAAAEFTPVAWCSSDIVHVSVVPVWRGLLPPDAYVTVHLPQGAVTVLVHDADRLGLSTWHRTGASPAS